MNVLGRENGEKFIKKMTSLKNVDLVITNDGIKLSKNIPEKITYKGEGFDEHIDKIIPEHVEEHFVNIDCNVFEFMGRRYLRFEDGSFQLSGRFGGKNQVKYGYGWLQRIFAGIEDAAVQLNKPEAEFNLHNVYSKFSK